MCTVSVKAIQLEEGSGASFEGVRGGSTSFRSDIEESVSTVQGKKETFVDCKMRSGKKGRISSFRRE